MTTVSSTLTNPLSSLGLHKTKHRAYNVCVYVCVRMQVYVHACTHLLYVQYYKYIYVHMHTRVCVHVLSLQHTGMIWHRDISGSCRSLKLRKWAFLVCTAPWHYKIGLNRQSILNRKASTMITIEGGTYRYAHRECLPITLTWFTHRYPLAHILVQAY